MITLKFNDNFKFAGVFDNNIESNKITKADISKHEVKEEFVDFYGRYDNLDQNIDNAPNTGSLGVPGKC